MNTLIRLENCLLPPPEIVRWSRGELTVDTYTTAQKMVYCTKKFFIFTGLLFISPITLTMDYFSSRRVTPVQREPDIHPLQPPLWPPNQRGFATSLFQTSGLGTKWSAPEFDGRCDWDGWMDNPNHVAHPEGFENRNFFTDILSDPTAYIAMLKEQNVTAHRLSLEWSVIEPRPGEIDRVVVERYQNLFRKLLEAGITLSVTLSHFVVPKWFYESGNFQNMSNVELYVRFALKAMELFPEVRDWWSFNELGVKAFQQSREVYPTDLPEGSPLSARVHAAGIATRNMLIAHCKLHQEVAVRYPQNTIGVTHQWMKFDTATGNWMESLFAYFFTKFGFTPVYQFFKDGRYSFEFPFMANIQFEIPKEEFEANGHFLKCLGVQAYPKAMVKMGWNRGQPYPGNAPHSIKNFCLFNRFGFSFGASCEPGGTVMRFGPRHRAEGMEEILDDAFALTNEICITEYGSDGKVQIWGRPGFELNNEVQANYLRQLTERIRDYCARTFRTVKGIFAWSDLRRQMEWENGLECTLGMIDPVIDEQRRMINWNSTPAADYLREAYRPAVLGAVDVSA